MDNKTIFVRTSKGKDEMHSLTSQLSGDVKRALLMVDGSATFGEIKKRAAPSMRASLGEMFQELEKRGFIQNKLKTMADKVPKVVVSPNMVEPPTMVVPTKRATLHKKQSGDDVSDLDFVTGFAASQPDGLTAEGVEAEKLRADAEAKSKLEIEAEKIQAQREAEAILLKVEQEAARVREETARIAKEEAENTRLKAQQEAKKIRDELEAIKIKAEQEAKLRLEAAFRERQEAEAARLKAEQEAKKMRDELEAAKIKAEQEAKLRQEAAAREQQQAEAARLKAEQEAKAHALINAEEAAKALEASDQPIAKQEREAAQASEAMGVQSALTSMTAPTAKSDIFSFEAFNVDEPQSSDDPNSNQNPERDLSATQQSIDAVNSTQPEDILQAAGQQVSQPVASDSVESKPSQEQIKHEAQERIAAEAQAKVLADAHARAWAEAEQRALEVVKANAERVSHQAEYPFTDTTHVEKPVPFARVRHKPISLGRLVGLVFNLGIFLMLLLVGALLVFPYVVPMRDYMQKIQQMISARLLQPVHIGYLSGRILPTPRLVLGEIYIGEAKQFQAGEAQINFDIAGLFSDEKSISSVEFQNVKVTGAGLQNSTAWIQQLANQEHYPVSRMVINQGTLDADAFQLTGVEGELNFNPVGKFTQANLRANGGKFTLGINATPLGKLQVAITVHDSALPLLPNWLFDELNAKGELNKDELQISDFDARILGGVVQGNASIYWRVGWRAQGTLSAKSITLQNLNHLMDGNVEGAARFKMTAMNLADLADSVVLDGTFKAKEGIISGMDIVETARVRSKENLPGGRTHFDALNGNISFANNAYHFKQVKVEAGVLNAIATFDVAKQQLSGKMNVTLSLHDGTPPVDLQIGGAIDNPTLRYAH
jgi:hypothetical protein